jgi:phosphoglycolate phosphatase-like HAD superfamily hydrolase
MNEEEEKTNEMMMTTTKPRRGAKERPTIEKRASTALLGQVNAVAFDCDGVLIDARRSYDEAIRVVTEVMVKELTGARLSLVRAAPELIATMRRTGGFNSDWDTTYALTLFAYVALRSKPAGAGGGGGGSGGRSAAKAAGRSALKRLQATVSRFGSAPRKGGQKDADSFLDREFPEMREELDRSREFLGYPARPPESRMATLFDELYFGSKLYKEFHGVPATGPKTGFIELERLLVKESTLRALERLTGSGRLALITGRPSIGTKHTLGRAIMAHFNEGASLFVGDADLYPDLAKEYDRYRKPSPEGLVRATERLSSSVLLYVGDSAEDLMMVKDGIAQGRLRNCLFAGVYGTSPDAAKQIAFFEEGGADVIVESVNEIPSLLMMSREKREATRSD